MAALDVLIAAARRRKVAQDLAVDALLIRAVGGDSPKTAFWRGLRARIPGTATHIDDLGRMADDLPRMRLTETDMFAPAPARGWVNDWDNATSAAPAPTRAAAPAPAPAPAPVPAPAPMLPAHAAEAPATPPGSRTRNALLGLGGAAAVGAAGLGGYGLGTEEGAADAQRKAMMAFGAGAAAGVAAPRTVSSVNEYLQRLAGPNKPTPAGRATPLNYPGGLHVQR